MSVLSDKQALAVGAVLAVGGYLLYRNRNLFNPVSQDNLANQGMDSFMAWLTDGEHQSYGDWLYSWHNPHEEYELNPSEAPLWWKLENPQYLN